MPGILDRYLLWMFIKVLVITFISLTGLYVVIHAFSNFAEFQEFGEQEGSSLAVVADYYGPHVLSFFDRMGAVMALLAAIFVMTTLLRTNELTAVLAAGISQGRVVAPLICAAIVVSLLGVANRELWIPQVRHKLMRKVQDYRGDQANILRPTYDYQTDVFIGGRQTVARDRKIVAPQFRLPATLAFGSQLSAETAVYAPADANHPAGYLLDNVSTPHQIAARPSAKLEGKTIIITPRDAKWLTAKQCFVASDVNFEQLAGGSQWRRMGSTPELVRNLRNPSLDLGNDARVMLHGRLVQPLLDMSLFVLGLPLVIGGRQRNLFHVSMASLGLMGAFFLVMLTCHALGSNYLLSPAFAAWLPVMIFSPAAYAAAIPLWK